MIKPSVAILVLAGAVTAQPDESEEPEVPAEDSVSDDWDFYFCQVDHAPASIFLNLGLIGQIPLKGVDTLYAIRIEMSQPGEHEMGTADEAEALYSIGDGLSNAVSPLGLRFVGRLRNHGIWQLTFMGPAGKDDELEELVRDALRGSGHSFESVVQPDPGWSYYREFLYPDDERMQWILNRRLVDRREEMGDKLTKPRRVDHWVYFAREEGRSAFVKAVTKLHFTCEELEPVDGPLSFGVHRHSFHPYRS